MKTITYAKISKLIDREIDLRVRLVDAEVFADSRSKESQADCRDELMCAKYEARMLLKGINALLKGKVAKK